MTGYLFGPWHYSAPVPLDPQIDPSVYPPQFFTDAKTINIVSYDLPLECLQGVTGRIVTSTPVDSDIQCLVLKIAEDRFAGRIWCVTGVKSETDGLYTLSVKDDAGIYDDRFFQMASMEDVAVSTAVDNGPFDYSGRVAFKTFLYQNGAPYYDVSKTPRDHFISDAIAAAGNVKSETLKHCADYGGVMILNSGKLARLLRSIGLALSIDIEGHALVNKLSVLRGYDYVTPVFFKDGHSEIISANVKKISTTHLLISYGNTPSYAEYVSINGTAYSISEAVSGPGLAARDPGDTKAATLKDVTTEAGARDYAQSVFDANGYDHKIVFASDNEYHINQPVRIMLESGPIDTVISYVGIKSTDNRFQYNCGEMPATAADQIISNAWGYKNLPNNPTKGTLVFV